MVEVVVSFVVVIGSFELFIIFSFCESTGKVTGLLGVIPITSVSNCSLVIGFSSIVVVVASVVDGSSVVVVPNKNNLLVLHTNVKVYNIISQFYQVK